MNLDLKEYIDFKVYSVIRIRDKYGFRIVLKYNDNSNKTIQQSGYCTKKAANDARDIVISELYGGTFIINKNISVSDFSIYWLEKVMKKIITYNSYESYKNIVYNHITKSIGKIKLSDLNVGHIQKLYNEKTKYSHDIAKLCKTVMNSMLKYAFEKKLISKNMAKGINLPKCVKNSKYRTIEIDTKKTLNVEQVKLLIEKSKNTPIYLQIMFAVLMGLRKQEINGLKYSDIDYVHKTISIQRQLGNKANTDNSSLKIGEYTKQEIDVKTFSSNRILEIPDILFEAILEEKKKYEKNKNRRINDKTTPFKDYDYIICSTYGNPRSKSFHFQYWKKLLEECNLPNIRFHDLRATYSTLLLKNNFSAKAISKQMGHATEIITMDVYGDNDEIIADCVNELNEYIEEVKPILDKTSEDNTDVEICDQVLEELIPF